MNLVLSELCYRDVCLCLNKFLFLFNRFVWFEDKQGYINRK